MDERWLSVDDICKYLKVSNETVYKWIEHRGMPGHRVGRCWKFKVQEIDEWVESGRVGNPCVRQVQAKA